MIDLSELRKKYNLKNTTVGSISTELVRDFIASKGGKTKENFKYKNARLKFEVFCKNGHLWETSWMSLQQGNWCPFCVGLKIDECFVREVIESKGGTLDKDWKYINAYTKFFMTCRAGHQWKTFWNNIQQGRWCPYCDGQIVDEEYVRNVIKGKKGILPDNWSYINDKFNFMVKDCGKGHSFKTHWGYIRDGHWCPKCSSQFHTRESEFRSIIEATLNCKLSTKRPIRFPKTGGLLEFDGYNKERKIAFEYQDYSHYKPYWKDVNKFGIAKALEMLSERQERDAFKINRAKEIGVCLIVMPYWIQKKEWINEINRQLLNFCKTDEIKVE
jgi:hypothetical protein